MIETTATFTFLCPICHERSEHDRSRLRTRSHCPRCREPVVLLDRDDLESNQVDLHSPLPQRPSQGHLRRPPNLSLANAEPLEAVLLFCRTILARIVAFLFWPLTYVRNRLKARYRAEGWRGLTRFRLSHFLIAVTVLSAAMAYYGPRYAREWKLQKEADSYYESKLALADERLDVAQAVATLGGSVYWRSDKIPPEYYRGLRGRDWKVLETKASIRLYGRRSSIPLSNTFQWRSQLTTICEYPQLLDLSLSEPRIDGEVFESLPASESLRTLHISGETLPLELYQWCARCSNLQSLYASPHGWRKKAAADDACLEALSQSPSLASLSIVFADVSAEGVAALSNLKTLRELSLWTTDSLDLDALAAVASLPLERLSLRTDPISDEAVARLCEAANMRELHFGPGMIKERHLEQLREAWPGKVIEVGGYANDPSEPVLAPP